MIFRLSQKLSGKIKVKNLPTLQADESPFADWSAHLFVDNREQLIILLNTRSLYCRLIPGKGITNASQFIDAAGPQIRALFEERGLSVPEAATVPGTSAVHFARALNKSVTGSMNDMIRCAYSHLEGGRSLTQTSEMLNRMPMFALPNANSPQREFAGLIDAGRS